MTPSQRVIFFIGGFFVGILLASFGLIFPIEVLLILAMVMGILYVVLGRIFGQKIFRIIFVIGFGLWVGLMRFWLAIPHFSENEVAFYRDLKTQVEVEGIITGEPDIRSNEQYVVIEAGALFWGSGLNGKQNDGLIQSLQNNRLQVSGKVRIKAPRYPQFAYGDRLKVRCLLESPQDFDHFDYSKILAKEGIYTLCNRPSIKLLAHDQGNIFWSTVFMLKNILLERINQLFTEPEASIVAGVLVGARRSIPQKILNDFSTTGLSHVLAISGYNINLMIAVFGMFFKSSSRKVRFFGMLGGILLFLLFTGFSGSVIRAAWMGFFVILAKANGRKGSAIYILVLSAFAMVLVNPYVLVFDLSFELSFLATLGLVVFMPKFEKYFEQLLEKPAWKIFKKIPGFISEGFWVTIAAQIFATPLILIDFGKFSLIAPVPNVLFLPFIPWIMFFSFIGLMISFLGWGIGAILTLPFTALAWICLKFLLGGVGFFAIIPFAAIQF